MSNDAYTIWLWVAARISGILILLLFVWWACRNRQFSNREKPRWLALDPADRKDSHGDE